MQIECPKEAYQFIAQSLFSALSNRHLKFKDLSSKTRLFERRLLRTEKRDWAINLFCTTSFNIYNYCSKNKNHFFE